jgi:hypothetical protein
MQFDPAAPDGDFGDFGRSSGRRNASAFDIKLSETGKCEAHETIPNSGLSWLQSRIPELGDDLDLAPRTILHLRGSAALLGHLVG